MILHERYFGTSRRARALGARTRLGRTLGASWKTVDDWREDFAATGQIRGVGWAILYRDRSTDRLFNWWVGDHESGTPPASAPILVMDVWEHAFMVDHGAGGRKEYVEAFMENVNWDIVTQRYDESKS